MTRTHSNSFNSACQIPPKPFVSWLYSCPGKWKETWLAQDKWWNLWPGWV